MPQIIDEHWIPQKQVQGKEWEITMNRCSVLNNTTGANSGQRPVNSWTVTSTARNGTFSPKCMIIHFLKVTNFGKII
jgi:hypothetical protein